LEVDTVSEVKSKKKKKDMSMWIQEDADSIVDFTDRTAARKITGLYSELPTYVYLLRCVYVGSS
jgi:hypothetical protein